MIVRNEIKRMEDFETAELKTDATSIFVRTCGNGAPVLLLHGFPQTHLMWRSVAPLLAREFTVVCPDLREGTSENAPTL
jgi:haloacetate dehalogenase